MRRILERQGAIEDGCSGARVDAVSDEVTVALELEALFRLCILEGGFKLGRDQPFGVGVDVIEEVAFDIGGITFAPGAWCGNGK